MRLTRARAPLVTSSPAHVRMCVVVAHNYEFLATYRKWKSMGGSRHRHRLRREERKNTFFDFAKIRRENLS